MTERDWADYRRDKKRAVAQEKINAGLDIFSGLISGIGGAIAGKNQEARMGAITGGLGKAIRGIQRGVAASSVDPGAQRASQASRTAITEPYQYSDPQARDKNRWLIAGIGAGTILVGIIALGIVAKLLKWF